MVLLLGRERDGRTGRLTDWEQEERRWGGRTRREQLQTQGGRCMNWPWDPRAHGQDPHAQDYDPTYPRQ